MKPLNKVVLTAACGLLTFGGACLTFVQAQQPREKISDLTLANIEALALADRDRDNDKHATVDCYGYGKLPCPIGGTCETYTVTDNS